jgi:hypothetical protein
MLGPKRMVLCASERDRLSNKPLSAFSSSAASGAQPFRLFRIETVVAQRILDALQAITCPYRKSNPLAVDRESGDAAARCLICANLSLEQ